MKLTFKENCIALASFAIIFGVILLVAHASNSSEPAHQSDPPSEESRALTLQHDRADDARAHGEREPVSTPMDPKRHKRFVAILGSEEKALALEERLAGIKQTVHTTCHYLENDMKVSDMTSNELDVLRICRETGQ
jgi:hypothetical protein